jgi:hypothetical protein
VFALVACGCVLLGWFLPYVSFAGVSGSLSDDSGNIELAVILPSIGGIIAAIVGLRGQRFGAGLAAGAAAGVSTMCLVFVAWVYEIVSNNDFGSVIDAGYRIGFFLHVLAGIAAVIIAFLTFSMLQDAASREAKSVPPVVCVFGAIALAGCALGFLLPDNGFSIFDIPSGPIKGAYLTFIGVFSIVGIVGFASARPSGAAIGAGAAFTPLLVWVADAMDNEEFGSGFFGGFNDGNSALVALGAATAFVLGIVGMATGRAAATRPAGSAWTPPAPGYGPGYGETPGYGGAPGYGSAPGYGPTAPFDTSPSAVWSAEPVDGAWGAPPDPLVRPGASGAAPAGWGTAVEHSPPPPSIPAAWHPDPTARHQQRYWDGTRWTSPVADAGTVGNDPV